MQLLSRLFFLVCSVVAIGVALWLSLTIAGVLIICGGLVMLFLAGRQFLMSKGILNPTPGVPMEPPSDAPVIEGEFEEIEKK